MLSTKLVVEYYHPYVDDCRGPGRWYSAYSGTGEEVGYVWTNDRFGFGMILTTDSYASQTAMDWFNYSRNVWGETETSATDAFESYFAMQSTWSPAGIRVESGDLQTDLLKRVDKELVARGKYVEYGITVRDDGEVLELIRHDPTGSYLRQSGRWVAIDPEAPETEYPTVYGQDWHEVSDEFIDFFDQNSTSNGVLLQDIQSYFV